MKTRCIQYLVVAGLVCVLGRRATAQELGKLAPLPDNLPPGVEARVGKVDLNKGLPTSNGIRQILEIQDFQRACQIYQWALPAIGAMGWQKASIAAGANADTDWTVFDDYVPRSGILTPNTDVSYVMMFADLEKTGPLVLGYPAGKIVGILMDAWQRPLFDYGLTGPERGQSVGKLLIIGPGQQTPADTAGFHVVQSSTRLAWGGFRVLDRAEKEALAGEAHLYPYSQRENPPASKVINASKAYTQSPPRGLEYWADVNELIQREPVQERDRFFMAMLRSLGIEKGKPFEPDARMKRILEDGASMGEEIARVVDFEKPFETADNKYYRKDAHWQYALVVDPSQRQPSYDQLDQRTAWFYEAIGCSYKMITEAPGLGSIYLETHRDKDGDWLEGGKNYRLRISPNPPMEEFWAVSVYSMDSRTLIKNTADKAELSSNTKGLHKNDDGSIELYFGPTSPPGKEANWVETEKGTFWFAYFRLYAPTQAYFDKSWPLPDFERVK